MERQTDVEIYLRDCPPKRIMAWVESVAGALKSTHDEDGRAIYDSSIGVVVITQQIEDQPLTSVWFNTPRTPWASDVECARAAAAALGCVTLCSPGDEYPDAEEDELLEIDGDKEQLVLIDSSDD
jgi:hypothetical protein